MVGTHLENLSEQGGWERSLDGRVAPVILLWVPGPFPLHNSEVGVREGMVGITWGVCAVEEVAGRVREMEEGRRNWKRVVGVCVGGVQGDWAWMGRGRGGLMWSFKAGVSRSPFPTPWNVVTQAVPFEMLMH